MKHFWRWLLLGIFWSVRAGAAERPNILMIVVDDMGYGDMGKHGHPWLKTPNFDRLHDESVRMSDFLVSPTCAPTRAALMTGAHEFRSGVTHTIYGMEQMNQDCVTLADVLSGGGYATGMFGKWHLGDENGYEPWKRGFEVAVIAEQDARSKAHQRSVDPVFYFNGERRKMTGVRDDLFAQEAMKFMGEKRAEPFFCYYATYDPHGGHHPMDRFREELKSQMLKAEAEGIDLKMEKRREGFFGEVLQVDWILGKLMSFLEKEQLAANTLVCLVTDNGATGGTDIFNAGMRGHKTTAWLGGTRALAFWRLPGVLKPGVVDESCAHLDVLPTLAEVAEVPLTGKLLDQVEGRSAWGLLTGDSKDWPERTLFAHVARWPPGKRDQFRNEGAMVRRGDFDLVRIEKGSLGRAYTRNPAYHRGPTPGGDWGLYHRHDDPGQTTNLAAKYPELVKRLSGEFDRWWEKSERDLIHEKK